MLMTSTRFVLGLSLALLVSVPPAWGINFTSQSNGTFVTPALDLNGDGTPAISGSGTGPTTAFGVFSSESIGSN